MITVDASHRKTLTTAGMKDSQKYILKPADELKVILLGQSMGEISGAKNYSSQDMKLP